MLMAAANRPIDNNTTFSTVGTCRASSAARSRPSRRSQWRLPLRVPEVEQPLRQVRAVSASFAAIQSTNTGLSGSSPR